MVKFKASLSGKNEVPPNSATAAHFRGPAPEGKNASIMVPINPHGPSFAGSATLTGAWAKTLMDGDLYVNIHAAANKGGEIRGQLKR
jgi:hypothetical protein